MGLSRRNLLVAGGLTLWLSACSVAGDEAAGDEVGKVEVFSWWAGPGEKEGLEALVADFRQRNPGIEFDNAAVAGGAGTIARTVLATRLENDDPPDSYQAHAGLELDSDIEAGYVEDIRYLYDQQHWRERLPKGLVEALTFDGKIYSVPVNIHRANLLWYNPALLKARGLTPPTSWAQFLTQAAALRTAGILPLSIGPAWTQKHLLECVLLGELGADAYTGLWNGATDWKAAATQQALALFVQVLDQSDIATAAGDWQPALDKVVAGTAAYNVMGDWADAYLRTKGLVFQEGYSVAASPGSEKVYDFLSDSFTLPKGAPRRRAAEQWLIECGSVSGQDAFNPQKGSVPARLDADKSKYTGYLALAIAEWTDSATRVVGSLTHGVVAGTVRSAAVDAALALFVQDRDTMKFAAAAGA
ncbi:ABC transporter substrate-binding protein [Dactylosporangium siamense]|uniref:Probable sugar-binding periplasmic protein n=1 Tax=Dactylosporangium siamense TaxID=685454 RepID=A0A919U755_9ACTN|nr:ABC transporter substrate-binding protein [Dactylosporangium siamense]GIG44202.1 sugar ABC transporter substrate-binding protein [Dactylosporangium siamense]